MYEPDSNAEQVGNVLDDLYEKTKIWAKWDQMSIDDMVLRIQREHNFQLDVNGIKAAVGICRDAITLVHGEKLFIPENTQVDIVKVPLRDDVPAAIKFIKPDGSVRYEVLTGKQRKKRNITGLTVYETDSWIRQKSRKLLARTGLTRTMIISPHTTQGQGE